jgi:hypothetical protein
MLPATDADDETEGVQIGPIAIFGPCTTTAAQNVMFTVGLPERCDVSADSDAINDIDPGDPANLSIVSLAAGTDSALDVPKHVGTDPVEGNTPLIADGSTSNEVVDCADVEIRDEFDNVLDPAPVLACTSSSGLGIVTVSNDCEVDVVWVEAAADTTDTINCEATDYSEVDSRNISIPLIAEEPEVEGPDEADALVVRQEGPQTQAGEQTTPCGEAIIQIFANGPLVSPISIEIDFAEGSAEGAELRTLTSSNALPVPFAVALAPGEVLRYVVFSPESGAVDVVATDLGGDPLDAGTLGLTFCQVVSCDPVVTVTCGATELCDPEEICTTCTAVTTCGEEEVEGAYTWELNGAATTATTGNSVEICGEDLNENENTLTATDTTNEDAQGEEELTCGGEEPVCAIDVLRDSLPKSNWFVLPLAIRIETTGIDPINFTTPVTIACDADGMGLAGLSSILPFGKFIVPSFGTNTTVIIQNVLIWPVWVTQSGGMESETCTVTVGDCAATDTFELNYLPFFLSQ